MTPARAGFRPHVEDLEGRVVPASGLDADFFDSIQFEYEKAGAEQERVVRVLTAEYQNVTQAATDQYNGLEAAKVRSQQELADNVKALLSEYQKAQTQVDDYRKAMENRFNEKQAEITRDAQTALNTPVPGETPQAQQKRAETILAWTAQQYENLTKSVTAQYNEVQLQFQYLEAADKAKYSKFIDILNTKFAALNAAEKNLLDAYNNYQVGLVSTYYNEVTRIRNELLVQLSALQQLYANQTQIATTSPYTSPSSLSGSGSGGSTVFFDDNAPKGH